MLSITTDPTGHYASLNPEMADAELARRCYEAGGLLPGWIEAFHGMSGKRFTDPREFFDKVYAHGGGWTHNYHPRDVEMLPAGELRFGPYECYCAESSLDETPDPDCPECKGTGEMYETEIPYIRWDMAMTGVYGGGFAGSIFFYPHAWVAIKPNMQDAGYDFEVTRMD